MNNALKRRNNLIVFVASIIIFVVISYPTRLLSSYFVISDIRLAAVLSPCFGFVFGPAGAFGCAVGNSICDYFALEGNYYWHCFVFQCIYGLIPWVFRQYFKISGEERAYYRFTNTRSVLRFYIAVIVSCFYIAAMIGITYDIEGSTPLSLFEFIFANNISMNFIFSVPLVILLVRIKRWLYGKPSVQRQGIGETMVAFFMLVECTTILVVCIITYFQICGFVSGVEKWNTVFRSAFIIAILFAVIKVLFMMNIEKRMIIPLKSLAGVWQKDRQIAVEMCQSLYNDRTEIGELSRAFLDLIDEIQINVMKVSTEKTRDNGVGDIVVAGSTAMMTFTGSLQKNEAEELSVNLVQIPKSCTVLDIDTQRVTFMTGEVLRLLSEFVNKRKDVHIRMRNAGESTRMILSITGFDSLIELV